MTCFRTVTLGLALGAVLVPGIAFAVDNNSPVGGEVPAVAGAGLATNEGHFVCSAAILANGGVFSGEYVNPVTTLHLSTGTYQVGFLTTAPSPCPVVTIASGWFRVCQPDTLGTGTLAARSCTVADRSGTPSAVWVQTFSSTGALVDTPFTLQLSR